MGWHSAIEIKGHRNLSYFQTLYFLSQRPVFWWLLERMWKTTLGKVELKFQELKNVFLLESSLRGSADFHRNLLTGQPWDVQVFEYFRWCTCFWLVPWMWNDLLEGGRHLLFTCALHVSLYISGLHLFRSQLWVLCARCERHRHLTMSHHLLHLVRWCRGWTTQITEMNPFKNSLYKMLRIFINVFLVYLDFFPVFSKRICIMISPFVRHVITRMGIN